MANRMTIFALSSAVGRAGVAVVRVSGPGAGHALDVMTGHVRPEPRRMVYRTIRDPSMNAIIDRGLVVWFPGVENFTGEDSAEFHVHGGRAVVARLLSALARMSDFRLAKAGEFAMRAFYAGKIDLAEAEGLADLIDAETEAQRLQALRQADGALSKIYNAWRQDLIDASALIEAAIDFSDEQDVCKNAVLQAVGIVERLGGEIAQHLDDNRRGEIIRDGFRVVLSGPVNAGKSSLFNWLCNRDAAIVSSEPGTTRDVIDVKLDLDGIPIVLVDTAGFRDTSGVVEMEGIRRSLKQIHDADLVLWMSPAGASSQVPSDTPAHCLAITSKIDLAKSKRDVQSEPSADHNISVRDEVGLEALRQEIIDIATARIGNVESPALTQTRHRLLIEDCLEHLMEFTSGDEEETELRAEDLRLAANAIGRITGRVDVEDLLDQIFGRFCIGK